MLVGSLVADVGGDLADGRLRFAPATSVSLEEYAAAFTSAFVGYHFRLTLDAARLARKVRVEQHDLQHSLVAYEGDSPVGVAALAVRGEAGGGGGFGGVPPRRGGGLGRVFVGGPVGAARARGGRRGSVGGGAPENAAPPALSGAAERR